jgi:hypothetical protein
MRAIHLDTHARGEPIGSAPIASHPPKRSESDTKLSYPTGFGAAGKVRLKPGPFRGRQESDGDIESTRTPTRRQVQASTATNGNGRERSRETVTSFGFKWWSISRSSETCTPQRLLAIGSALNC